MRGAYVEYAYRLRIGKGEVYRVDCALSDFPARRAMFEKVTIAYELVWARVAGSLV